MPPQMQYWCRKMSISKARLMCFCVIYLYLCSTILCETNTYFPGGEGNLLTKGKKLWARGGFSLQPDSSLTYTPQQPFSIAPPHPEQQFSPGNAFTFQARSSFVSVAIVCLVDIVLNTLKPYYVTCFTDDGTGCLGARLQRAVWELGMAGMALLCSNPARPPTPAGLLLLQGMLFLTAVIDLLFFAPVYGFATNFERCVCRKEGFFGCQDRVCSQDYAFGLGRLSVVVQSMATGLFFFAKAIVAGGAYRHYRDEAKARTQARAMGMALGQFQQPQHAPTVPAPSPPDGRPLPQQQGAMVGSSPVRTDGHDDEGADSVADLEQEK
mmetsp:Transcript_16247/g.22377  ORF Transcript_16247/g.22377 Transcript_16247/m.22377 type:complete len:324 (-) Transcript_16247:260-1231(-)